MRNMHNSGLQVTVQSMPFGVVGGQPYLIGNLACIPPADYDQGDQGVLIFAGLESWQEVTFTADRNLFAPIYIREDNKLYDTAGGGVYFGVLNGVVDFDADATQTVSVFLGVGALPAAAVAAGEAYPNGVDPDPEDIDPVG